MKKKCLLVCLLCCLLRGLALAEEPMTETVLFEGSQPASGGWTLTLTNTTTHVNSTIYPTQNSQKGQHVLRGCRPILRRHVRIHLDDGDSQGCMEWGSADGFAGRR